MEQSEGTPSAVPVAEVPPGQGGVSEQNVPVSQPPSEAPQEQGGDEVRRLRSIADQRLAQLYQAQQLADARERQLQEVLQRVTPQQTQPDPQTDFPRWLDWKLEQSNEKSRRAYREEMQSMVQQAQEIQWQQAHPNVDINQVKAWAQMNRVGNLDHALTLMNLNQNVQNITQQVSSQALNQFRQPQQGAVPVRGAEATGAKPQVSFVETLKAYRANPSIADSWTPEFRADFDRELRIRYNQT